MIFFVAGIARPAFAPFLALAKKRADDLLTFQLQEALHHRFNGSGAPRPGDREQSRPTSAGFARP